jgi:hypothetical protein
VILLTRIAFWQTCPAFSIPFKIGEDILKRVFLPLLLLLTMSSNAHAANYYATGIIRPSEYWSSFYINATDIYHGAYLAHSEFSIITEYMMTSSWWGSRPTDQPFRFILTFQPPKEAVIIRATIRMDATWIEAVPEDVLTAERLFNDANKGQPRCLLRQQVMREYSGLNTSRYQLEVSPVYYAKPFAISLTYLVKNELGLDLAYASASSSDLLDYWDYRPISYNFLDVQRPETRPVFTGIPAATYFAPFTKQPSGWWQSSYSGQYYWGELEICWPYPKPPTPTLAYYHEDNEGYYQITAPPPVLPEERKAKRVLILYDLGIDSNNPFNRDLILDLFQNITLRSLAERDSMNILLIDQLQPRYLRDRFISASQENIVALLNEMRSHSIPQMSALPQLLRSATDYFNQLQRAGEIWLITDSERDAYPVAKANDILSLSINRLEQTVKIKIIACGRSYYGTSYSINGRYYQGNDYLFENMSRISEGGLVRLENYGQYALPLAMADLLSPALDLMEIDPFPHGGFCSGKYKFHPDRSHYPVLYPYIEIGRAEGNTPFTTGFYGNVDGEWYHKEVEIGDTLYIGQVKQLKTMWHALHIKDLLQQPQSWGLVDEIGRISKENHIVSPYCGFVVPSKEGYAGFLQLEELDTLAMDQAAVPVPERFEIQAYPNPFNSRAAIEVRLFHSDRDEPVTIRIFSLLGRLIHEWQQIVPAGETTVHLTWDGQNDQHQTVGTGIYFLQARVGSRSSVTKITCLK